MPCPVASTLTLSAAIGGFYTLLVQDIKRRFVSWFLLLALASGWYMYFAHSRTSELRIVLDIASTIAVLGGGARVFWLVRYAGVVPPLHASMMKLTQFLLPIVRHPFILSIKVWLLCMIVTDLRGIAEFSQSEYWVVSLLLVAAIAVSALHIGRVKHRTSHPPNDVGQSDSTVHSSLRSEGESILSDSTLHREKESAH